MKNERSNLFVIMVMGRLDDSNQIYQIAEIAGRSILVLYPGSSFCIAGHYCMCKGPVPSIRLHKCLMLEHMQLFVVLDDKEYTG